MAGDRGLIVHLNGFGFLEVEVMRTTSAGTARVSTTSNKRPGAGTGEGERT